MTAIRLIAVDLDGTLLDRAGRISPDTLTAITSASRIAAIAVATGRRTRKAVELTSPLPFGHFLISCSGAHTEERPSGRHFENHFFGSYQLEIVLGVFTLLGMGAVMFSPDDGGELTVLRQGDIHPHLESYLARASDSTRGSVGIAGPFPKDVHFVSTVGDAQMLEEARARLRLELAETVNINLIRNITGSGCALDVLPGGVSKWAALKAVAGKLGIPESAIGAIGDDENDIDMLQNAAVSVAMGNACPEAKAAADYVAGDHDGSGVAEALDILLRGVR